MKWNAGFQRVRSSKCHPRFSSVIKYTSLTRLHILNPPNRHIKGLEETANTSMNILANSSIQILDGRKEIIIYTFAHTHTHKCTHSPTLTQAVNVRWKVTHYARWQTGIPAGGKSCLRGRHMHAYISSNHPCCIFSLNVQHNRIFQRTLKNV